MVATDVVVNTFFPAISRASNIFPAEEKIISLSLNAFILRNWAKIQKAGLKTERMSEERRNMCVCVRESLFYQNHPMKPMQSDQEEDCKASVQTWM